MVRRSSASPSPAPQTKLRLSGPFCYTHQCFICGILQRGITELFLVIVTDFLNNCYIIKIRKCKSHGYLINSYLAFCFLLFSMTTLLQLGVSIHLFIHLFPSYANSVLFFVQKTTIKTVTKPLFTWSGGPLLSGVGFFCFVSPRA